MNLELLSLFTETRAQTEILCEPLEIEDYVVQPIVDVSPPKWHLGHTTWFFEEFILTKYVPDYEVFDKDFSFVFNSYYESVGEKTVRTDRGNLSRPTVEKIYEYRTYVTQKLAEFLKNKPSKEIEELLTIGIHHEKQHQELLLTDIKYILGNNPLVPVYNEHFRENKVQDFSQRWFEIPEGIYEIGYNETGFCYDNELGRHKVFLNDFSISNKLVTNEEYLEFMEAGGYEDVLLWHSEAWEWLKQNCIESPQYWHKIDGEWCQYTLSGLKELNKKAPLTHISYYEAAAFAQWKKLRLPTEFEWEIAQEKFEWGTRWEWTESAYLPYPKYKKAEGALGEYNGKFMVNQKVLRGGSVATPENHTRPTYRNFFHPHLRWQFTGLRLAK
ncbi:MAG TPA: ergothioneine biosynthesis protein EgtB [Flavobacteriaceae bacterium]|nr:ergothioneine biosynthesis protein EgtB [Flavobacteriaceae bacterium]